ncbi:unnamed protein product [Discosporangium mesarthrocarpum]
MPHTKRHPLDRSNRRPELPGSVLCTMALPTTVVHPTLSRREFERLQSSEGLEPFPFMEPVGTFAGSPVGRNMWNYVEEEERYGMNKRKASETLNDEMLAMLKDEGLEGMALEVGTLQGGQIASLQGSSENAEGASAIMGPALFTQVVSTPVPPVTSAAPISGGAMTGRLSTAEGAAAAAAVTAAAIPAGASRVTPRFLHAAAPAPSGPLSLGPPLPLLPDIIHPKAEQGAAAPGPLGQHWSTSASITPLERQGKIKASRDIGLPPPVPVPPMPGRQGLRSTVANRGHEDASTRPPPAKKARKTDVKASKGLRHFSMMVCRKVEEKGTTTYNEVADELVRDFADKKELASSVKGGRDGAALLGAQYDEKNIRRRVYDALNVLMAIDIISKERKEINWKGLPPHLMHNAEVIQRQKADRRRSIAKKNEQLEELLLQQIALRNLARRNRLRSAAGGSGANNVKAEVHLSPSRTPRRSMGPGGHEPDDSGTKISMPFIVVNTSSNTVIQCEMAENRADVFFNFSHQFEIADDSEILKRLGLHKCRQEDLPVLLAKDLIPRVPRTVYLDAEANGSRGL